MPEAQIDFGGTVGGDDEVFGKPAVPADAENSGELAARPLCETGHADARHLDESVVGGAQARDRQDLVGQGQHRFGDDLTHYALEGLAGERCRGKSCYRSGAIFCSCKHGIPPPAFAGIVGARGIRAPTCGREKE